MNQPTRPTLWALLIAAALATACARSAPDEAASAEPGGTATATARSAQTPDGATTAADAADELAQAARAQETEDAEPRALAEREAQVRAREEELARRELEERERRLREREREVADREARLAAARVEQERRQAAAAEEARVAGERAAQERAEAERAEAEAAAATARQDDQRASAAGEADREEWTGDEAWRRGDRSKDDSAAVESAGSTRPAASPELLRAGMQFDVEIEEALSSGTNQVGDTFRTTLVADVRTADGTLVAPAGSELWGEVVEVRPLRRVGGQAALGLSLDRLVLPTGETVEIRANLLELGKNKKGDKARIAGAVIAGAILGSILGDSEGALVGAAAGAAASTAYVVKAEGREVEIPAGTVVTLAIEEVVTVRTEYREPRRR